MKEAQISPLAYTLLLLSERCFVYIALHGICEEHSENESKMLRSLQ